MYKVLIVDDEISVREAIKILGDWQQLGVDKIFEAQNGKSAEAIVEKQKPDIVLVDMRMPEMNGIDLIKSMNKKYPQIVFIVVSGYDDYMYMKEAIRYKASDYLLKPITRKQLNDALTTAVETVSRQRQKQMDEIKKSIKYDVSLDSLKEKVYLSAVEGNFNEQIRATYLQFINYDDKASNNGIMLISFLNAYKVCKESFESDFDTFYVALNNIISEICHNFFEEFCFKNNKTERGIIVVASFEKSVSKDVMIQKTAEAAKRVIRKLKELFNLVGVAGIGTFSPSIKNLAESYKKAYAAIGYIDILNSKDYVRSYEDEIKNAKETCILGKMAQLRSAFEGGNLDCIKDVVNDYLVEFKGAGRLTLQDANKSVSELIFILNDITLEFDAEGIENMHDIEALLKEAKIDFDFLSFDEFNKLLISITTYFFYRVKSKVKIYQKFDAKEIKDYIDKNYFNEITISMFTEKYYLSKAYIMKLFKQDFGMSIYEYVQKVRMNKATELLKDPKINIQNISEMVGYSNNNYFSKAFKNYFHISPSGYRIMKIDHDDTLSALYNSSKK